MRLGLIGLGRIGAFHATTLTSLDAVDSLVVYDQAPALVDVGRASGSAPSRRASVEALLAAGIDGVVIAAATDVHPGADPGVAGRRAADILREAGVEGSRAQRGDPAADRGQRAAGADRLPAPLRHRVRRGPPRGRRRRARLPAHGPLHHPGPGATAGRLHQGLRRHLPRLQRPRLRCRPLRHRPGGRRGVRGRLATRAPPSSPTTTTSTPPPPSSPWSPVRSRWCRTPATTPAATTSASSCTARTTASRPAWSRSGRSVPPSPVSPSRTATRTPSSWTGSPPPSAPSWLLSPMWSPARIPSPCTVADAVEVGWIAEAATLSLREHRPIRMDDLRTRGAVGMTAIGQTPQHAVPGRLLDLGGRRCPVPRHHDQPDRHPHPDPHRRRLRLHRIRSDQRRPGRRPGWHRPRHRRRLLQSTTGITTIQLEWITNWWTTGERRPASDGIRRDLFDAVRPRRRQHQGRCRRRRHPVAYDHLCAGFDALATDAAQVGVKIGYENIPGR